MRIRVLLALPLLILCSAALAEPQPAPDSLSPSGVEDLVRLALRDNPELASMRAAAQAAAARPAQARALPDPRFTYGWMGEHLETARGPQSSQFGLSQEFPFFGKRGLMGQMAEREAGVSAERVRAMELALAAGVRQLAADIAYLDGAVSIQSEDRRLLGEIREIANTRYATGEGRLEDVARIEVELAENEQELLALHRDREVMASELNRLLGRDAVTTVTPLAGAVGPDPSLLAAADSLVASGGDAPRPELRAAETAIARSEAAARFARRSYFPDFMLGAQYFVVDEGMSPSPEAGTDAWMVELGVNLPIWFGKLGAGVREARQMQVESRAALAAERNRVRSEIVAAAAQVRRLSEIVAVNRDRLLPQAELALSSARSSYRAGGIGFLDLLDTERSLIRARLTAARARADLARAAAELARATAEPLPQPSGVTP